MPAAPEAINILVSVVERKIDLFGKSDKSESGKIPVCLLLSTAVSAELSSDKQYYDLAV